MNKYEQAIKDIKYELSRNYRSCKWDGNEWVLKDKWQKRVDLLEELVVKSMPKKPIVVLGSMCICPSCRIYLCNNIVRDYKPNNCPDCKQALDWSVDEG